MSKGHHWRKRLQDLKARISCMEKISLHPVSEETWDLLPFFLGENRDPYLPKCRWAQLHWEAELACRNALVFWTLVPDSRWLYWESKPVHSKRRHPLRGALGHRIVWYTSLYTGTPTLWVGGLGLGEVNKVLGFACAAANETPPCSWSVCWNLGEVWPLWNWGPSK